MLPKSRDHHGKQLKTHCMDHQTLSLPLSLYVSSELWASDKNLELIQPLINSCIQQLFIEHLLICEVLF